ncbi:MAG: hypothetical protein ACQESK_03515 [Bacteroidota bacterium]
MNREKNYKKIGVVLVFLLIIGMMLNSQKSEAQETNTLQQNSIPKVIGVDSGTAWHCRYTFTENGTIIECISGGSYDCC